MFRVSRKQGSKLTAREQLEDSKVATKGVPQLKQDVFYGFFYLSLKYVTKMFESHFSVVCLRFNFRDVQIAELCRLYNTTVFFLLLLLFRLICFCDFTISATLN